MKDKLIDKHKLLRFLRQEEQLAYGLPPEMREGVLFIIDIIRVEIDSGRQCPDESYIQFVNRGYQKHEIEIKDED